MNKILFTLIALFFLTAGTISCKKERGNKIKNITLSENLKSGDTYTLDLNNYADADDMTSITQQAVNFATSQIDTDVTTKHSLYHFSYAPKFGDQEDVVITIQEASRNGGGNCHHDDDKTIIHIHFTIQ